MGDQWELDKSRIFLTQLLSLVTRSILVSHEYHVLVTFLSEDLPQPSLLPGLIPVQRR